MRRLFWVLVLFSSIATADGTALFNTTTQSLTGPACTSLLATDGLSLTGATGWRAVVSAPSGQTITAGSASCCFYSASLARWMPCGSPFDIALPIGARDAPTGDIPMTVDAGRLYIRANGVLLSGADTTVTVTLEVHSGNFL